MKPLPHEYHMTLTGRPTGYATLAARGLPDLAAAPPAEYDGAGDAWSPEHPLLASVGACFLFTLRAVAAASKLQSVDVEARTSGTVARDSGVTRFTDIVVRATIGLPPAVDATLLQHVVDKAAARCLVSSSLQTPVRVEVSTAERLAA